MEKLTKAWHADSHMAPNELSPHKQDVSDCPPNEVSSTSNNTKEPVWRLICQNINCQVSSGT